MAFVGHFLEVGETASRDLKVINFEKEINLRNSKVIKEVNTSYISGCRGDSGSGQWITQDESPSGANEQINRNVLVAIATKVFQGTYYKNGKKEHGVCGADIPNINGEQLVSAPVSIKTTYGKILTWIKRKANIR